MAGQSNEKETSDVDVIASDIIRMIPFIYLVSPTTGREVGLRIVESLEYEDAKAMLEELSNPFTETPHEVLTFLRRYGLLEFASDWRFMTPREISNFISRQNAKQDGAVIPLDELPTDTQNQSDDDMPAVEVS
ncbi:hypothetical protein JK182_01820 [Acetobacter okinawensis]|uniref:hypothetical protein n=1 Tax=Acetobacter okinawensis TaxID=1076594 RepID=UPI001BA688F5|nr:hypothetical protein [Acetobacter okinawensis]MBS0987431.1 hypothetical protein [Acetobacter okinawensis]